MQKRSFNFAEIKLFKIDYSTIMNALKNYAKKALDKKARAVILIGSLAKGNYTAFSDADIIIISDYVPKNLLDRIKMFLDPELPIEIQPLIYTTEEIIKMARNKRKIIKEILEYGKLLAGGKEIIDKIRKAFISDEK